MIINKTTKTDLAAHHKLCTSGFSKAKGLMFSKKIYDYSLVFVFSPPRVVPLHMFFVFFTIDVLFVDENMEVVDLKRGFKPFTFYNSRKRVKYVLEFPNGTIDRTKTTIGDVIEIK